VKYYLWKARSERWFFLWSIDSRLECDWQEQISERLRDEFLYIPPGLIQKAQPKSQINSKSALHDKFVASISSQYPA
jgi:hypothetical protein